ncbi:hypothetical protein J7438_22205 [Thalassotalea sp. G20_0]|uniref:hypothetical protein n=1 Tax=Thalassotalea sp. G20_0 TaxID=2821093 RepID=UPI001ADBA0A4|nr:hypothetical protein [Thalassotalea sp. G20_0]MBO9496777.1 hypothetical protein [Thalassotalea sp. G20_0]
MDNKHNALVLFGARENEDVSCSTGQYESWYWNFYRLSLGFFRELPSDKQFEYMGKL